MVLRGTMQVNAAGHLTIGGCDTIELARQYQTPLYVIDEKLLRGMAQRYVKSFTSVYPDTGIVYAGKALLTTAICRIIDSEGLFLDVVSGGELYTALAAGFPTERVFFHGNNKSVSELELALDHGVGRIVVDNFYELHMLEKLAAERNVKAGILLRITPGVEAHTHTYIQTGQLDSKFGFPLANGIAMQAVEQALACRHITLKGLHCHIGSQIFDITPFPLVVRLMLHFMQEIYKKHGIMLAELDLGGGLGIRYSGDDPAVGPEELADAISRALCDASRELSFPSPQLFVEPGRSIVGEAGTTLYTVGSIKDVPGIRRYVAVDGGMADNPRVSLYQAKYEAVVANRMNESPSTVVSIAGKCCESGDMLIQDIPLPSIAPGDILAIFATGAYNYSMASNYNRLPRPAMILVKDGRADLIVRRESYADIVRNDLIPDRLNEPVGAKSKGAV